MKEDFLNDLYCYCTEQMEPPPHDPERQKAVNEFLTLEEAIQAALGHDFLTRYQWAEFQANSWQERAAFLQGLRFGARFMLTVLSPQ